MLFADEYERKRPSKSEKQMLYNNQKGKCMYCGTKYDIRIFHVDHKTPLNRGGSNSIGNKQLLCGPCNNRKGNLTDGEFRKRYRLTPTRQAKGPPGRQIPPSHFDAIKKQRDKRKRARERDSW